MIDNKHMTVKERGHKGGSARTANYDEQELSKQAKRAAKTVEEKYPGFHSEIGSKGKKGKKEYPLEEEEFNSEEDE